MLPELCSDYTSHAYQILGHFCHAYQATVLMFARHTDKDCVVSKDHMTGNYVDSSVHAVEIHVCAPYMCYCRRYHNI